MAERKNLAMIGAAFVLSLALLVGGILWFKSIHIAGGNLRVKVEFPSASGLMKGDPVEVRGVVSGQVSKIAYESGHALLTLDLDRSVKLHPDATFVVESVGIMGQKKVTIEPGWSDEIADPEKVVFQGIYQPGIPEFMGQIGHVLDSVERLANRMDALLSTMGGGEEHALGRIVRNTDEASADLARLLKESRGDIAASAHYLRSAMEDLHQTLDGREDDLAAVIDNSVRATMRLDSALVSFKQTSDQLNAIMGTGEARNGTLAQVVRDPQLYEEMLSTLRETRALVTDIRANPKKYVKVSLF